MKIILATRSILAGRLSLADIMMGFQLTTSRVMSGMKIDPCQTFASICNVSETVPHIKEQWLNASQECLPNWIEKVLWRLKTDNLYAKSLAPSRFNNSFLMELP